MNASEMLNKSAKLIATRGTQRDQATGERSMLKTVKCFNELTGSTLTEREGWMFMVMLKAVRAQYGTYVSDDYEDMAAYAALANECCANDIKDEDKKLNDYMAQFLYYPVEPKAEPKADNKAKATVPADDKPVKVKSKKKACAKPAGGIEEIM